MYVGAAAPLILTGLSLLVRALLTQHVCRGNIRTCGWVAYVVFPRSPTLDSPSSCSTMQDERMNQCLGGRSFGRDGHCISWLCAPCSPCLQYHDQNHDDDDDDDDNDGDTTTLATVCSAQFGWRWMDGWMDAEMSTANCRPGAHWRRRICKRHPAV